MVDYTQYLKDSLLKAEEADKEKEGGTNAGSGAGANTGSGKDARGELEQTLNNLGGANVEKTELKSADYERKSNDAMTDDEINALAEANLTEYKQLSENAINAEASSDTAAKNMAIENEKASAAKNAETIEKNYEQKVTDFENDSIKRGVARSSIAANNSAAIRSSAAEALSSAALDAENNIKQLESEIAQLEANRAAALDNFNITYAAKLTEKINGLKEEQKSKENEVLEYNNALAEKELKSSYDKAKLESDIYSNSLDQAKKENELADSESASISEAKYAAIYEYLKSLSPAAAKEAVKSDSLIRKNVNDYYYYKLYTQYVK